MDKTELRELVFDFLRRRLYVNIGQGLGDLFMDSPSFQREVDTSKVRDILWELLLQGVLAPGKDSLPVNFFFPYIHVTEYGKRCLEANAILPHDPDGYLQRLQQQVRQPLDDIVLAYVREALLTFRARCYPASTVMLGVASERCVDLLIEAYSNAIEDRDQKAAFEKKAKSGSGLKSRFDALRKKLSAPTVPKGLMDALDIQLSGILTVIRYSRNDAGHPTGLKVDRDTAHANLLLFPQYCKRVYDLIDHFQRTRV